MEYYLIYYLLLEIMKYPFLDILFVEDSNIDMLIKRALVTKDAEQLSLKTQTLLQGYMKIGCQDP